MQTQTQTQIKTLSDGEFSLVLVCTIVIFNIAMLSVIYEAIELTVLMISSSEFGVTYFDI